MKTYLAGEDIALQIPLRTYNGEPVVPDTGSVKLTVRDNTGTVVINKTAVTMAPASTEASVVVPAVNNAIGDGRFTMRTVVIDFTKTGRPMVSRETYRLTAWLNTTVTPDEVRAFIGVDAGELPNSVIDIVEAYLDVENDITEATLTAALGAADNKQIAANRMILAQAVLNQIPGLPLRLSQNESNGVFSAQRPKIDLIALELRAQAMYADAADLTAGRFVTDRSDFLVVTLSPDATTGV